MKVVVPEAVESVAAALKRSDEARLLRLVLGDDYGRPARRRLARLARKRGDDVVAGVVVDALRGVEAQAVHVELLDPVAHVRQEELADVLRVMSVEVDGLAPLGLVSVGEVVFRELSEVVAVGAEVVVDNVEDDCQPESVCLVDEASKVFRLAVEARGRERSEEHTSELQSQSNLVCRLLLE